MKKVPVKELLLQQRLSGIIFTLICVNTLIGALWLLGPTP